MTTKLDKQALRQKIQELDIDNEMKSQLLSLVNEQKKYGLVWEDKPEEVEAQLQEELPVFTEVKDRAIHSDAADAPNHILIEGDNLHALTALSYTHAGKIDVIYIDPPYNTGNKDFVYNDSFVDKEDGYRHSKWLSFMKKRLDLAHHLLSDKGVIFISIDDNEQAQLKLLCDEVFGEENFVASLPRITKSSGKTTDKIAQNHDYILIITNSSKSIINGIEHTDAGFKYKDEYVKERGLYKLNQTLDYDSLQYSSSLDYPIEIEGEILYPGGNKELYDRRKQGDFKRADWAWRWSLVKYEFGLNNGFVVLKKSKNGYRIYTKTYQNASIEKSDNGYAIVLSNRTKPIPSIEFIQNQYSNDNAKKEIGRIFNNIPFDYPKPTSIMGLLLKTIPNTSTILDFFAGSGTTLHATMQLNAEDGGHRQCILITNNENGICENVTYERNKRVINGYTTPKGEEIEGLKKNNLRYYKTDFVPSEQTNKNKRALVLASTDMLCIKNNVYVEQATFDGKKLRKSDVRYFDDGKTRMLIIYNELAVPAIAELIRTIEIDYKILVYVFSNTRYAYADNFEEVADKVTPCALPAAIYDAYKKVIKPKKAEIEIVPTTENTESEDSQKEMDLFSATNDNEEGGKA